MRKENVLRSIKRNSYYLLVLVGAIALVAVVCIYNKNNSKSQKQSIDLNEPATIVGSDPNSNPISTEVGGDTKAVLSDDVQRDQSGTTQAEPTDNDSEQSSQDTQTTNNPADGLSFDDTKELMWPIVGNVIMPYSMDTTIYFETLDQYKCNAGIFIQAPTGSNVSSSAKGVVTSIVDNKEFGNVVTIDVGSGYSMIYGQLSDIIVNEGDLVEEGAIIGKVADPTAFYSKEGTHLYFKILKDDNPINPMTILE